MEKDNVFSFSLGIFRKATFTGLGMNYHSFTYMNFKINNIKTLIFRAFRLCGNWHDFHMEVEFLLNYFRNNGYPDGVIFNQINMFLNSIFTKKTAVTTVHKLVMYVKFPFLNEECCRFMKKEFSKILDFRYPQINFRFVFVNNNTIQGLLNHKERLPDELSSGLVYSYECGACGATYIGQTRKALKTRAAEHFGKLVRTGSLLVRAPFSSIRDHIHVCGSGMSLDSFKKVRSFSNIILLKIYESIEIYFKKPVLNQDNSSHPLVFT